MILGIIIFLVFKDIGYKSNCFLLTCVPQGKTSKMAITICLMYMTIIYLAYVVCFHSIGKKASLCSNLSISEYICVQQ